MPRKVYNISSNLKINFGQELLDVLKTALFKEVRFFVKKAVDAEMSKIFQYIHSQIIKGSGFSEARGRAPQRWPAYTPNYQREKHRLAPGKGWFAHGVNEDGTPKETTLANSFGELNPGRALSGIGSSTVGITRDGKSILVRLGPRLKWSLNNMEFQLQNEGLLDSEDVVKLQNKVKTRSGDANRYRSLIGPTFQYFRDVRIPHVVAKTLRGL
jgi:hypothetical protein